MTFDGFANHLQSVRQGDVKEVKGLIPLISLIPYKPYYPYQNLPPTTY